MCKTPKFNIGERVMLVMDRFTVYTITDRKQNPYGYWLFDLSGDEGDLKDIPENDIEQIKPQNTCDVKDNLDVRVIAPEKTTPDNGDIIPRLSPDQNESGESGSLALTD